MDPSSRAAAYHDEALGLLALARGLQALHLGDRIVHDLSLVRAHRLKRLRPTGLPYAPGGIARLPFDHRSPALPIVLDVDQDVASLLGLALNVAPDQLLQRFEVVATPADQQAHVLLGGNAPYVHVRDAV